MAGGGRAAGGHEEREIKVLLPEGVPLPDLTGVLEGVEIDALDEQVLDARYLDTPNRALLALGCTFRRRSGEGPVRWTLKVPAAGAEAGVAGATGPLRRVEHEVTDDAAEPPAELVARVEAAVGPVPLVEVARLRSHRLRWRLRRGDAAVGELVDDRVVGRLPQGGEVHFREVELEVGRDVTDEELAAVRDLLMASGGGAGPARSKLDRVLAGGGEP